MFSPFRHLGSAFVKNRPIHLTFFVTRKCNAACPFCFYLRSGTGADTGAELSVDEISKLSASLGDLLWLAFSGGEIFLRSDLPEISRIFYRNNRPAIMLYPTNGLLPDRITDMTKQILSDCQESTIVVKLSIDGLYQVHDAVRKTPGSFEQTMRTYELLRGLTAKFPQLELGVNTVFCPGNQDTMDGIIDFVKDLDGIRTHTISLVRGNLADSSLLAVDHEKYRQAIERLEQNLRQKDTCRTYRFRGARIKAAQDILQRRIIARTQETQQRAIPCYAGNLSLVLTETGNVYPCEILNRDLGNVRDCGYDLHALLRSDRARAIINSIRDGQCHCTHECNMMTNILFNPRLYPAIAREYLRLP